MGHVEGQAPSTSVTEIEIRWDKHGYVIPTNPPETPPDPNKSPFELAKEFDLAVYEAARDNELSPVEIAALVANTLGKRVSTAAVKSVLLRPTSRRVVRRDKSAAQLQQFLAKFPNASEQVQRRALGLNHGSRLPTIVTPPA